MHGLVPPLADCFNTRPETGPAALDAQPAGQLLVLAAPPGGAADWPGGTGKTQLAVHLAQTWCRHRADSLLIWVTASSRAAVLSSYVQAFADRTGMAPAGDAETIAARFVAWLAETGPARGWWSWTTSPHRRTWKGSGRRARRAGSWSRPAAPVPEERAEPAGPAHRGVQLTRGPDLPHGAAGSPIPTSGSGRSTCLRTWAGSRSRSPRPAPRSLIPG